MQPLHSSDPTWVADYRTLGRLGAGGMGMVLLGRSPDGGLAAIKLIRTEYADDPAFRTRFRREVAIARRVRNRWAVPVVAADTEAAAPWLATEFVPGPPLNEAIAGHGPFPVPSVRALGVMLAEALEAVHEAGLVHRDLKPGNVLLGLDGPRLIDFGIARALDDTVLTATDVVVGSPGFLSPEQAQARTIGPASDLFSLGCVLAYAATGQRPFGSGPVEAMLFRTVYDEPDLAAVPGPLRPVIEELLTKDPEQRLTAAALRARWEEAEQPPQDGWLPAPVTRLISDRAAEMLALPAADPTEIAGPPPGGSDAGQAGSEAAGTPSAGFGPPLATGGAGPYAPGSGTFGPSTPPPGARGPAGPRRRQVLLGALATLAVIGAGAGATALFSGDDPDDRADGADTDTDTGGEGRGRPANDRPQLAVGVQADLEGDGADVATAQIRGAELAVEHLNADADHPFRYRLATADDGGSAERAADAAAALIDDPDVIGVLGAGSTAALKASIDPYVKARLPLLTVSDGSTIPKDSVFASARTSDQLQMTGVMTYVTQHDQGSTAVVHTGSEYSREVTQGVRNLLARTQTVHPVQLDPSAADHRATVRELVSRQPDCVIFGGDWEELVPFAQALDETGWDGYRIATHNAYDQRLLERAGGAVEGWVLVAAVVDATQSDAAADFAAAYTERFEEPPPPYAAEAYDAVHVIALCAGGLREDRGFDAVTRQEMAPSIREMRHRGVTKTFTFEPADGRFTGNGVFFYRVTDGAFVLLGTDVPQE
ncbi:bifunctional serine/threonine-protein kinase/ABC transporter substrate-binding protein [Streptomyces lonarensis]|uniref:ABC transporter substrate-binding protein n=1 Tax=Streptomyces lonarensis TaxID=700599 RepID=A0A7X6D096_9ACTN|nr:bifunctional serine/threonine-protein kinase/ABC transporter substrate-binding protein [Streptomyces lonarensis]NJQ05841.1 ABC transporter substrate-binding protein [Streptomyces lonarensis]